MVPDEVEGALFEHPAVAEAAVAWPAPFLARTLQPGWFCANRVHEELRSFLLARLADFKVPRRITVVDTLRALRAAKS